MPPQSDPAFVDAYMRQLAHADDPGLIFLAWVLVDQDGITRDDLVTGLKAEELQRQMRR